MLLTALTKPILTPLLIVIERVLRTDARDRLSGSSSLSLLVGLPGSILIAGFTFLVVSDGNMRESALSIIPVVLFFFVYASFVPRTAAGIRCFPRVDVEGALLSLSIRIVIFSLCVFGIQTFLFGIPQDGLVSICLCGGTKALAWLFLIPSVCRRKCQVKVSRKL